MGVTKFDGKYFYHYTQNEGLCFNGIRSILQDRNDNLWFGSYVGGVSKFDGEKFVNYSKKSGLGSNKVLSMLEDKNGMLWFGSDDNGLTRYDGKAFIGALFEDRSETVWIGSSNRLTAIYPEAEVHDTVAPNIQLTNIQLFNENIPWIVLENKMDTSLLLGNGVRIADFKFNNVSKWYYQPENLNLAYNNNFLTFSFIGLSHKLINSR
ncbi:MAG: two-component regulator propeller domain-containing protein [Bacteroidota bacterium]|nr:two-component regulator propeller domain-containing protein [Bacteroidota bacterium]